MSEELRMCEYCGCNTNARIRARCKTGREVDKALADAKAEIGRWKDNAASSSDAYRAACAANVELERNCRTSEALVSSLRQQNAEQSKEIERLKARNTVLEACAKGDRICMWCRQVIGLSGDNIKDAASLADHMLHCKDHPLARMLDKQGEWVLDLQEELGREMNAGLALKARVGTLEGLLCRTTEAHLHERSCGIFNAEPCNCLRGKIDAALNPRQETPK